MEDWKPIKHYEGLYEVSNLGNVRRVFLRGKYICRNLSLNRLQKGYPSVGLSSNGIVVQHRVHSLVVAAFIAPIPNGMTVNHKNLNRCDNTVKNLEIATYKENNNHAMLVLGFKHRGPRGSKAPKAKLKESDIPFIRQLSVAGLSIPKIAKQYGVWRSTIYDLVRGHTWSHI